MRNIPLVILLMLISFITGMCVGGDIIEKSIIDSCNNMSMSRIDDSYFNCTEKGVGGVR